MEKIMMKEFEAKNIDKLLGDGFAQGYLFAEGENILAPRKATQAEKNLRIKTIRRLLIAGLSRQQILEYCANRFLVSPKTVYKYLDSINQELVQEGRKDRELNYGLAVARYEQALVECNKTGDMQNLLRALKDLSTLQGLITHKIGGTGEDDGPLKIEFVNKSAEEIKNEAGCG